MSTVYTELGDADGLTLPEGAIAIAVSVDGRPGLDNPLDDRDLDAAIDCQAAELKSVFQIVLVIEVGILAFCALVAFLKTL